MTKTYRGRSLEELIPQIRADFGPEAVILRRREGLAGGVGGFFQRRVVEVEAGSGEERVAAPDAEGTPRRRRFDAFDSGGEARPALSPPLRDDEAMAEGLSAPAIEQILSQARPFAGPDPLAPGERWPGPVPSFARELERAAEGGQAAAGALPPPAGPESPTQPGETAGAEASAEAGVIGRPELPSESGSSSESGPPSEPEPAPPAAAPTDARPARPRAAANAEAALVAGGISPSFAAELVEETCAHLLPFSAPRNLRRLMRHALARRVAVAAPSPGPGRVLAFVGGGGSGKTLSAARVAFAYAARGSAPVLCLALAAPDGGSELRTLLAASTAEVHAVAGATEAGERIAAAAPGTVVVIDTPGISPARPDALAALAAELGAIEGLEVHLALPAATATAPARGLLDHFAALGALALALTHADETDAVGGAVEAAIGAGVPFSFVGRGVLVEGGLEPASAAAVAGLVLS